jgi:hypothetical protein
MLYLVRLLAVLSTMVLLGGCKQQEAPPLDQQLYVWQRQWTPAHEPALRDSRTDFSTLRVLTHCRRFPRRDGAGHGLIRRCLNVMVGR